MQARLIEMSVDNPGDLFGRILKAGTDEEYDAVLSCIVDGFTELQADGKQEEVSEWRARISKPTLKALISLFYDSKGCLHDDAYKGLNYFVWLGFWHFVLGVNYYTVLHAPNLGQTCRLSLGSDLPSTPASGFIISSVQRLPRDLKKSLSDLFSSVMDPLDELFTVREAMLSFESRGEKKGEINSELSIAHYIDTPIGILQEEWDRLSDAGKLSVDYLEIWRRFAKRDFVKPLPRSIETMFADRDEFVRGVFGLWRSRAGRRGVAPKSSKTGECLSVEELLSNAQCWLDLNVDLPAELCDSNPPEWVNFARTWLLFFATGSAHHVIDWAFTRCFIDFNDWNNPRIRRCIYNIGYERDDTGIIIKVTNSGSLEYRPPSMFNARLIEDMKVTQELSSGQFKILPCHAPSGEISVFPEAAKLKENRVMENGLEFGVWEARIVVRFP